MSGHDIGKAAHGFDLDAGWHRYIADCARRCAASYDEQQDLISETVRALLEYDKKIEHPRSFIRTTVKNLATNRGIVGAGAWERNCSELGYEVENIGMRPEPTASVIVRDTLERLLRTLTPMEAKCYNLLKEGYEQRDLPEILHISRQAVSKILIGIRRKFEDLEKEDSA